MGSFWTIPCWDTRIKHDSPADGWSLEVGTVPWIIPFHLAQLGILVPTLRLETTVFLASLRLRLAFLKLQSGGDCSFLLPVQCTQRGRLMLWEEMWLWPIEIWIQILPWPLPSCEIPGKSLLWAQMSWPQQWRYGPLSHGVIRDGKSFLIHMWKSEAHFLEYCRFPNMLSLPLQVSAFQRFFLKAI